jgi:hypothetical protein
MGFPPAAASNGRSSFEKGAVGTGWRCGVFEALEAPPQALFGGPTPAERRSRRWRPACTAVDVREWSRHGA